MSKHEKPNPSNPPLYVGAALERQNVAARPTEREQAERRRVAKYVTTVYRQLADGTEEEVEVGVGGGMYRAEPDVGITSGGWEVADAVRIDTGAPIELTAKEEEAVAIEAAEDYADRREQAMCDAADASEDR